MEKYAADDRSKWRDTCNGMTPEQIQEETKSLEPKDYLDDNVVISEEVMKMTHEERRAEIARLEAEAAKEKERILKTKQK